jgi:hypothetical protein
MGLGNLLFFDSLVLIFGLAYSYFLALAHSKVFGSYRMNLKPLITFLLFVWAAFGVISSIYVIQCSYEIKIVFEEPKNFFVLGLFVDSLLFKKLKR